MRGPTGPQGPPGPAVTINPPAAAPQEEDDDIFSDQTFVLILLIWLFVVTVVIVIIISVMCCIRRRREKHSDHTKLVATGGDSTHSDDISTNYSLDAVNRLDDDKTDAPNVAYVNETEKDAESDASYANMKDVETTSYSNGTIGRDDTGARNVIYANVHRDEIINYWVH